MKEINDIYKYTKDLTKAKSLDKFVDSQHDDVISYDVGDTGTCMGKALLKVENIAVQGCIMSRGTRFPFHTHSDPVTETLHIYEGSAQVYTTEDDFTVVHAPHTVTFHVSQRHSVLALTDLRMVAVTMPADESYPNTKSYAK